MQFLAVCRSTFVAVVIWDRVVDVNLSATFQNQPISCSWHLWNTDTWRNPRIKPSNDKYSSIKPKPTSSAECNTIKKQINAPPSKLTIVSKSYKSFEEFRKRTELKLPLCWEMVHINKEQFLKYFDNVKSIWTYEIKSKKI